MSIKPSFAEAVLAATRHNASVLCLGLDPEPGRIPACLQGEEDPILAFNREIIAATSDLVCAYKPNIAFYEAQGLRGLRTLERTRGYIPGAIPVIGDAKRGDIGNTAGAYARALFDWFNFDAVTANPYLGYDSLQPFLEYQGRGVFVLCRTSNPGAAEFQDLLVAIPATADEPGQMQPLYEVVARRALSWPSRGTCGLVVGATSPVELARIRALSQETFLLIPGIGAQGGDAQAALRVGANHAGERALLAVSRAILYAGNGPDFAEQARKAAQEFLQVLKHGSQPT